MENIEPLDIIVILAYLVGIAALGIYQVTRVKSSGDYFAGGRKFSKWMMITHSLGSGTHADDPVGVAGAAYERGISGIWYTYAYLFCTPFYWIIAPFFRRSRYLTTADFFEERFGKSLGLLYAIMGILTFSVNMGTLLKGTGTIVSSVVGTGTPEWFIKLAMMLQDFGIYLSWNPEWLAIWTMTAIFVAYGFAGGIIATVITEFIQGFLIVIMSLLLIPYGIYKIGGFERLHSLIGDASKFSLSAPEEMTIPWIITATLITLIGIVAQPHIMEVCSTGKTEFEGRVGFTYGNFIKRFCAMGWALCGLIVLAMVALPETSDLHIAGLEHRENAFGIAIGKLLPPGMTGLMFASILAAQMSTLSAFMVAGSALIARNIYKRYIAPEASDKNILILARFGGFAVVGLGLVFCYLVEGVAEALTIFWGLSALTGVFVWAGVLWKKTNATGAWASFGVMAIIWLLLGPMGDKLLKPLMPDVSWLGLYGDKAHLPQLVLSYLPIGIVALIVGSLLGKSLKKDVLEKFYLLIKTPVGREEDLVKAGVNMIYKGHAEGHPWELKHPALVNWGGFAIGLVFAIAILGILYWLANVGT
ncbi:sodium:solute symporter family protein [candidate division KSB1 bacterium]|nr:sodium:solute symporter family protein [candidate division KSB1 bacterium]